MAIKIGKLFSANKLLGTSGDDTLIGGLLNDVLIGGAGADVLFGGRGFDTADYSASSAGVHVDLQWGIGWFGDAQGDTLNSIEKVIGSAFDDTLIAADWGNNVFIGGKGADTLVGGLGVDSADYSTSSAGVTVNLTTGQGSGGDAEGDSLKSMENVVGSDHDDTLIGDKGNNSFTGGAGKDVFVMSAGDDTIKDFTLSHTPVMIDFNDLVPQYAGQTQVFIEPGYGGLDWGSNVWGISGIYQSTAGTLGLGTIVAYVAINDNETEGTITTVGADFTLKSAYMGRIFGEYDNIDVVQVVVQGWDDGALKATQAFPLGHGRTLINFVGFDSIDKFTVVATGGSRLFVGFDDITLAFEGSVDKIAVPAGTTVAALVASAVSNGSGGALLTHSSGSLNLVGVDPSGVSADWFV